MPSITAPLTALRVAAESTWGTSPGSAWYAINPQGPWQWPDLPQAALPNETAVRTGFLESPILPGVQGGAGPQFKFPLVQADSARATGASDFAPDGWIDTLFGAVLGEGAANDTSATPAAGQGIVTGGALLSATPAHSGSPDRITGFSVANGSGARFSAGACVVAVDASTGKPYLVQIVSQDNSGDPDTMVIKGGPLTGSIATASQLYGGKTYVLPVNASAAASGKSVSVEWVHRSAQVARLNGCSGNAMVEMTAGQESILTFDFQHDNHEAGTSVTANGGSATAYPADAFSRILGRSMYVRIGATDGGSPAVYDVLDTAVACRAIKFDLGATYADVTDVTGAHGRSGRQAIKFAPRLTLSPYFDADMYTAFGSTPGTFGTRYAVSVVAGNATVGFFGIFLRAAQLVQMPTAQDAGGLQAMEWVFQPVDDASGFAHTSLFFG